jgi:ubiquinone/menaquinone biosynthesis C-methylase UbiE
MSADQNDARLAAAQDYQRTVVPHSTAPSAELLLKHAALQQRERVADVACGTGIVARLAAPLVGAAGAVVAVDVNPAMLTVGRALPVPEGALIEWREGDAQHLPLVDAAYDVVLCNHGLPFFPDWVAALREMRRVLAPGGRVCIAVWNIEDSAVSRLIWTTISRRLEQPLTTLARGFALGDAGKVEGMMGDAGFSEARVLTRPLTLRQPKEDGMIASIFANVRGMLPWLAAMPASEVAALARSVEDEIAGTLRRYEDDGYVMFPMSVHIAQARAR